MVVRKSSYSKVSKRRRKRVERAHFDPVYVRAIERTLAKLRAAYATREAELLYAVSLLDLNNSKARALVCGLAQRIKEDPFLRSAVGHPAKVDVYLSVGRGKVPSKAQAHVAMAQILEASELRPERADEFDMQLLLSFPTTDLKPDLRDKSKMEFYPDPKVTEEDEPKGDMEFVPDGLDVRGGIVAHARLEKEFVKTEARQAKLPKTNIGDMRKKDEEHQAWVRKDMEGKTQEEVRKEVQDRQAKRAIPPSRQCLEIKKRI